LIGDPLLLAVGDLYAGVAAEVPCLRHRGRGEKREKREGSSEPHHHGNIITFGQENTIAGD
jgi:hypothetical protein